MNETAATQAIVAHEARPVAQAPSPASEASAMLAMIERAARDPSIDVTRFEALMAMQERAVAAAAKRAYVAAFAKMQPGLPTIERNGAIKIFKKEKPTEIMQSTPYALWEDINDAIKPAMAEHGFSLSFRTGVAPDGKLTVTGILSHSEGHEESTTMVLMHDSTGSKNSVQAIGSSLSYGKRYTGMLLLNITSRAKPDRDDDGKAAGMADLITDEQNESLVKRMEAVSVRPEVLLGYFKIASLGDLPARQYAHAMAKLDAKEAHLNKGEAHANR